MTPINNSLAFAREMDENDPLKNFRNHVHFPTFHEKPIRYFTVNSLVLQPKKASQYIHE